VGGEVGTRKSVLDADSGGAQALKDCNNFLGFKFSPRVAFVEDMGGVVGRHALATSYDFDLCQVPAVKTRHL
jgi:hypothetical protein